MEQILIFIGARANSKGVKGKNIRLLMGKPLICYTIQQAIRWGKAKRIVVSTDSPEIAQIARKMKIDVPYLRPARLATDTACKGKAVKYELKRYEKTFDERYSVVVDLDVTAPIRKLNDLDNCLELYQKYRPKTLFSVVKSHKNPYFNMVELKSNGRAERSKELNKRIYRRLV